MSNVILFPGKTKTEPAPMAELMTWDELVSLSETQSVIITKLMLFFDITHKDLAQILRIPEECWVELLEAIETEENGEHV